MQCMEYYFKKMPFPDISFSPDGDFPVINIEKGIYQFTLDMGQLPREVTEISAGTRTNVVPSSCIARIVNDFDTKDVPFTTDGCKVISAVGKSAHGSTPQEGKNATWEVFRRLKELFPEHKAFAFIADKMCDYTGHKVGDCAFRQRQRSTYLQYRHRAHGKRQTYSRNRHSFPCKLHLRRYAGTPEKDNALRHNSQSRCRTSVRFRGQFSGNDFTGHIQHRNGTKRPSPCNRRRHLQPLSAQLRGFRTAVP